MDSGAGRRRVPGLRREEIALLAGVSSSYYTRLEQGQALNASPQVIEALSRALRLTAAERSHLHALAQARTHRHPIAEPVPETVAQGFAELLQSVGDAPAMVFGRRRDILAWNDIGHALFAGHLDKHDVDDPATRPNATELVFLDPHTRELYVDWAEKAAASVGHLRILAAQYPDDSRLLQLIGRLGVDSADFTRLWASNRIRTTTSAIYRMNHPLIGRIDVNQQLLADAEVPGQTLVICSTPRGSSSREALQLLSQLVRS